MFPPTSATMDLEKTGSNSAQRRPNLSGAAQDTISNVSSASVEDLFYHVLAVLHNPSVP